jgi:hypothetical protein
MSFFQERFADFTDALSGMDVVTMSIVLAITLVFWFIPTLLAAFRNRKNIGKIFLLNITVGWTTLGWTVLIFWALNPTQSYEAIKARLYRKNKVKAEAETL